MKFLPSTPSKSDSVFCLIRFSSKQLIVAAIAATKSLLTVCFFLIRHTNFNISFPLDLHISVSNPSTAGVPNMVPVGTMISTRAFSGVYQVFLRNGCGQNSKCTQKLKKVEICLSSVSGIMFERSEHFTSHLIGAACCYYSPQTVPPKNSWLLMGRLDMKCQMKKGETSENCSLFLLA